MDLRVKDKNKCFEMLQNHIELKNKMIGGMYTQIVTDECYEIALKCYNLGYDKEKLYDFCKENGLENFNVI